MKKTAYFAILCFIALPAFSQKEAMQTGTPPPKELTINGKPYSQYKAEQDALKKQQAGKQPASMANLPKPLNYTPARETADPALERMNEPVQYGVKVADDKGAPDPGKTVEAGLVKTEVKQPATTPEVPAHFRLPENRTWGNTAAAEIPVKNTGAASQIQSDPAQPVNAPARGEAYKTPVMKDVKNGGDKKDMSPAVTTSIPASVVDKKQQDVAKPVPEVPAQFRLPENAGWSNAPAQEKPANQAVTPAQLTGDPAQPLSAPAVAEVYKSPVTKDVNTNGGKKDMSPADAKNITPASIVSNKKAEIVTPAPEVPSQFRLPATQSWNGRPVMTEAANSPLTEKAASRTAADAPKNVETGAEKVQKPAAEKNTTAVPPAVGASTGETSKVVVPEVKYPQQEAPKKD